MKSLYYSILIIIIALATIVITTIDRNNHRERIYPAKVVEKILISPTDIPVVLSGIDYKGEPVYDPGKTKTSHAFVVVSAGHCAIIPVDEYYFHNVEENSLIPVLQKKGIITGTVFEEGAHYAFGMPK